MLQISTFVWLKKPPFLLVKHQVLLVKPRVQVKTTIFTGQILKFHGESPVFHQPWT
jgi:hypothetical protein